MPTFRPDPVFPVLGDGESLTVIISGCAMLCAEQPIMASVWLGLFTAALVVTVIDEDITDALELNRREAL